MGMQTNTTTQSFAAKVWRPPPAKLSPRLPKQLTYQSCLAKLAASVVSQTQAPICRPWWIRFPASVGHRRTGRLQSARAVSPIRVPLISRCRSDGGRDGEKLGLAAVLEHQTPPWRMDHCGRSRSAHATVRSFGRAFIALPKPGKIDGFWSPSGPPGDKNRYTLTLPANAGKLGQSMPAFAGNFLRGLHHVNGIQAHSTF